MWIASAFFALASSNPALPPPEVTAGSGDERPNIEVSAYFGLGIDNFAATDVRQYLNPNSSGQSEELTEVTFCTTSPVELYVEGLAVRIDFSH